MTYTLTPEPLFEVSKHLVNSNELISFLKKTADDLSQNGKQLARNGQTESAELDENIAIYIRECLIEELAENFDIDVS